MLETIAATAADLAECVGEVYTIEIVPELGKGAAKLLAEHEFDEVRLENLVLVYANEVAPIPGVRDALDRVLGDAGELPAAELARLRFDDQRIAYAWDRHVFSAEQYGAINALETATEAAEPFLLIPGDARDLVHHQLDEGEATLPVQTFACAVHDASHHSAYFVPSRAVAVDRV